MISLEDTIPYVPATQAHLSRGRKKISATDLRDANLQSDCSQDDINRASSLRITTDPLGLSARGKVPPWEQRRANLTSFVGLALACNLER